MKCTYCDIHGLDVWVKVVASCHARVGLELERVLLSWCDLEVAGVVGLDVLILGPGILALVLLDGLQSLPARLVCPAELALLVQT